MCFHYVFLTVACLSLVGARLHNGFYVFRTLNESLGFLASFGIDGVHVALFAAVLMAAALPLLRRIPGLGNLLSQPRRVEIGALVLAGLTILAVVWRYLVFLAGEVSSDGSWPIYPHVEALSSHISPIAWFGLLIGLYQVARARGRAALLPWLVFVWAAAIVFAIAFKTRYQWYHCRYFVKDIYPLGVCFIALGTWTLFKHKRTPVKIAGVVVAAALLAYSFRPHVYSWKRPFLDGALEQMESLNEHLAPESTVMIVRGQHSGVLRDSYYRLSVPLAYLFHHDVFHVPLEPTLPIAVDFIRSKLLWRGKKLYLLYIGQQPLPLFLTPPGARLEASRLYVFTMPEKARGIPKNEWTLRMRVYLYAL